MIGKLYEKLIYWSGLVGGFIIFLMIPLIFLEVVMRYVFNRAPMIADEFSAYMLVACVFIGLAYSMKEKAHIRVEFIVARLPHKINNWLRLLTLLIGLLVVVLYLWQSIELVAYSYDLRRRATTWLLTPIYIPQMVMPIGFALFILSLLDEIVSNIKKTRGER